MKHTPASAKKTILHEPNTGLHEPKPAVAILAQAGTRCCRIETSRRKGFSTCTIEIVIHFVLMAAMEPDPVLIDASALEASNSGFESAAASSVCRTCTFPAQPGFDGHCCWTCAERPGNHGPLCLKSFLKCPNCDFHGCQDVDGRFCCWTCAVAPGEHSFCCERLDSPKCCKHCQCWANHGDFGKSLYEGTWWCHHCWDFWLTPAST